MLTAARTWERHLIEVETGLPPDAAEDATPKPEYDPAATSLAARQRAKAAELTEAGAQTSFRTVERMRRRYRDQGRRSSSANAARPNARPPTRSPG